LIGQATSFDVELLLRAQYAYLYTILREFLGPATFETFCAALDLDYGVEGRPAVCAWLRDLVVQARTGLVGRYSIEEFVANLEFDAGMMNSAVDVVHRLHQTLPDGMQRVAELALFEGQDEHELSISDFAAGVGCAARIWVLGVAPRDLPLAFRDAWSFVSDDGWRPFELAGFVIHDGDTYRAVVRGPTSWIRLAGDWVVTVPEHEVEALLGGVDLVWRIVLLFYEFVGTSNSDDDFEVPRVGRVREEDGFPGGVFTAAEVPGAAEPLPDWEFEDLRIHPFG
jgi:hypothetical protein